VASKLDPRLIKYVLIGYYGRGAYKLFDSATGAVIKARNIIFEEGPSHLTLPQPPADFFPEPAHDAPAPLSHGPHHISRPGLPIAPRVRSTDPPLHPSCLAETSTLPDVPMVPPASSTHTLPSALRRSTCTINPTPASRAAEETLNMERLARECGEDWATDGRTPQAFMTNGDVHVPSHYAEAMRRPDLWEGPMQEELENLCSYGIFRVVKNIRKMSIFLRST